MHNSSTALKTVPDLSRAINNEFVILIMVCLKLELDIRLTGLSGTAAHFNGREGVIRGQDDIKLERWKVRMHDGKYFSVKADNIVRVCHGNFKRLPL